MNLQRFIFAPLISLSLSVIPVAFVGNGAPDPLVVKNDDVADTAYPGSTISYTVTYGNAGSITATGVTLHETVPDYTSFNATASDPLWSCVGTTCTLAVGSVAPGAGGSVLFVVTVDGTLPPGLEFIINRVTISSDSDWNADNNLSEEQTPVGEAPSKPSCLVERYYMYTLRDANQPEIWQRYCYIISNNGFPSVESQARICSVRGFDHVYRATSMLYSGWVYTDCNGNPYYGWPAWNPEWYRPEFAK